MPTDKEFPKRKTLEVRDTCLCLQTQRAARVLARKFDDAFRPLHLTSGQFSLLNALNRPASPTIGVLAEFLAMDRTTLTAALKPLQTQGWITVDTDQQDRRRRRIALTPEGHAVLTLAYPIWRTTHKTIEANDGVLRAELTRITQNPRGR